MILKYSENCNQKKEETILLQRLNESLRNELDNYKTEKKVFLCQIDELKEELSKNKCFDTLNIKYENTIDEKEKEISDLKTTIKHLVS